MINQKIIKMIPSNQAFDATELINKSKEKKRKIGIFPISDDCWSDVGQWSQYNDFLKNYEK